jgi:hypothetical protein
MHAAGPPCCLRMHCPGGDARIALRCHMAAAGPASWKQKSGPGIREENNGGDRFLARLQSNDPDYHGEGKPDTGEDYGPAPGGDVGPSLSGGQGSRASCAATVSARVGNAAWGLARVTSETCLCGAPQTECHELDFLLE